MKVKDYLKQVEMLDVKIDQRNKQIDDLRQMAVAGKGIDYSKDKIQTSVSGDAISEIVIKYVELENELNKQIDEFVDLKNKIIGEIQSLEDVDYVKLLYKRYIEYKSLKVIAVEMKYTYAYARTLHGRALQEFAKVHTQSYIKP